MQNMNDGEIVKQQYQNADKLNIRIMLHHKYSTNKTPFTLQNGEEALAGHFRKVLREILNNQMVDGVLHIPKEYGMFVCEK